MRSFKWRLRTVKFKDGSLMVWGDVDWIGLAQDRDRWRARVNSVLSLRVPKTTGKLSSVQTTRDLSSSAVPWS
jgi:hypothetical protein